MNTRKRSLTFDIKDQAQQLFFLEQGSPFDQLEFYIEQDQLIVSCLLPQDAVSGNQIRITANHQDNRDVDFIGIYKLKEKDIMTGTVEIYLGGSGKSGSYNLQLSLLGYKQRVKNSMDYMACLPREIHPRKEDEWAAADDNGTTSRILQAIAKYLRNEFSALLSSTRQTYLTERK
ncbi:hypothetical protein [Pseudoalteromonas sp. OOF1S-7]|uniref:hypothetical protein n=1 Tax=Pseudoalteromonas sp. OOF1S-7 TaxID=2917757 RepID=UPI001EF4DEBD|nr:hypothetical protein [Pseudoalteromonas sp. OOF1S-7]MCG7535445.1 hypothetical protein [Pseudoalteromonas sp. OOF1S-7]